MIKIIRNLLFVTFLFLIYVSGWSQSLVFDSLKSELSKVSGHEKIDVLLNIADELESSKIELSIKYTNEALELSTIADNKISAARCRINLGHYQYKLGHYKKARYFFELVRQYASQEGEDQLYCEVLREIGLLYSRKGILDSANIYFHDALTDAIRIHDTLQQISSLRSIGNVYYKLGQFDDALTYYHNALGLASFFSQAKEEEGKLCNNIGILLSDWKKFQKSLSYYQRALLIMEDCNNQQEISRIYNNMGTVYWYMKRSDSALLFYKKSLVYKKKVGDVNGEAYVLNNLGMFYGDAKDYQKSILYFKSALRSFETLANRQGIVMALYNIGFIFQLNKEHELATKYFNQSLNIAKSQHFADYILSNYEALKNEYAALQQWEKAYNALIAYDHFSDSLNKVQNIELVSEMEVKFDNEKHQAAIHILENQMKASALKKKKARIFILWIMVILLLVISATYFFVRQVQVRADLKEKELVPVLLRYQMNPVFINSSLKGITELTSKNRIAESSMFLSGFASLIRTFIETSSFNVIILDKEIETIRKFLKFHQLRYEHQLTYELNIANQIETEMMAVPPLLFFPILVLVVGYRLEEGPVNVVFDLDILQNYLVIHTSLSYHLSMSSLHLDKMEIAKSVETIVARVEMLNRTMKDKIKFVFDEEIKNDGKFKVLTCEVYIPIKLG